MRPLRFGRSTASSSAAHVSRTLAAGGRPRQTAPPRGSLEGPKARGTGSLFESGFLRARFACNQLAAQEGKEEIARIRETRRGVTAPQPAQIDFKVDAAQLAPNAQVGDLEGRNAGVGHQARARPVPVDGKGTSFRRPPPASNPRRRRAMATRCSRVEATGETIPQARARCIELHRKHFPGQTRAHRTGRCIVARVAGRSASICCRRPAWNSNVSACNGPARKRRPERRIPTGRGQA